MSAQSQVISIRPADQELAVPGFVPSVTSSPANVYIQTITAQTSDERRMSFIWRSPNSGLLLSPLAYVSFRVKVTAPYKLDRENQVGPLMGSFDTQHAVDGRTTGATVAATIRKGYGYRPLLCFGEGNTCQNAIESISVSVNGAVWTELSGNLYSRSLDRCFVPLDVQQRAYSTCGGPCNAFDDKAISGSVLGLPDTMAVHAAAAQSRQLECLEPAGGETANAGYRAIEGQTVDSSIQKRMDNFYDQVVASAAVTGAAHEITLEIKFPVQGCVFNSLWGSSGLSRADPRLRQALGIANYNSGNLTFNFKDLLKHIVRRLGRPSRLHAANSTLAGAGGSGESALVANDITVTFDTSTAATPKLHLTYIRLPSFRSYPQSSALSIYRRDVRRPVDQVTGRKVFDEGLFDSAGNKTGLMCASGLSAAPSSLTMHPPSAGVAAIRNLHEFDVQFNGLQYPQVPNFIFIVLEKSSEVYNLQNPCFGANTVSPPTAAGIYTNKWSTNTGAARTVFDTAARCNAALMDNVVIPANALGDAAIVFNQECAGRYIAQNSASNAAIMQLEITVQSAVGSWSFKSNTGYPYTEDRDLLFRKHVQSCCDGYMKAGRGKWQDRGCCALIACSDFLLGLGGASPGVVFPIILDVKCKFANRAAVGSGLCFNTGMTKGRQIYDDFIVGSPVCVGLFNQQIISIASSSAVISAQAFSMSTAASALSQQG
jgi:hypothetical protein